MIELPDAAIPPINAILNNGYGIELRPVANGDLLITAEHLRSKQRESLTCSAHAFRELGSC